MLKTCCLIISFFLGFSQLIYCNDVLKNIKIKHYLSHDITFDGIQSYILRDEYNLYWYVSDAGLVRFDGTFFTLYNFPDFKYDEIKRICSDNKKTIWLLLANQQWIEFNIRTEEYIISSAPYNLKTINDIYGYDNCIYVVNNDRLSLLSVNTGSDAFHCEDIFEFEGDFIQLDGYDNQLSLLTDKYIYLYNGLSRSLYRIDYKIKGLMSHQLTALHFDSNNLIICDSKQNLLKYNVHDEVWDVYNISEYLNQSIDGIVKFQDSNYVLRSMYEMYLLELTDNNEDSFYTLTRILDSNPYLNNLIDNSISDVYYDPFYQSFWISYNERGLVQVILNNMKFIRIANTNINSEVNEIIEDDHGYIWVSTKQKGLYKSIDNYVSQSIQFKQCVDNVTLGNCQICKSNNGNILIANDGLIQEYDLSKNEYTTLVKDAVYLDEITKIFVCSQNNLWIATTNGIVLLNLKTNRYEYILHLKIAKEENISLAEDYLGGIWFGCKKGLWVINRADDNFMSQKVDVEESEVLFGGVNSIYINHDNEVLVAYSGGVAVIDTRSKQINNVIIKRSKEVNDIISIVEDNQGELWYGSNTDILTNSNFEEFLYKYRIPGNDLKGCKLANGNLIWINNMGITYYNPQILKQSTFHNKVMLIDVRLLNTYNKKSHSTLSLLHTPAHNMTKIKLNSFENSVDIHVSDASYSDDHNLIYYRLLPHDDTWLPVINSSFKLLNLKSGNYQLQLKSVSPNRYVNDLTVLDLEVKGEYYRLKSIAIIVLLVVVFVCFVICICYYYRNQAVSILNYMKTELSRAKFISLDSSVDKLDVVDIPVVDTPVADSIDLVEIKSLKIVIVEYYKGSLTRLTNQLSKQNLVIITHDGKSAYDIVMTYTPDIIIIDTLQEFKYDVEYYKLIKQELFTCNIPIITYKFLIGDIDSANEIIKDEDLLNKRIEEILNDKKGTDLFYGGLLDLISLENVNQNALAGKSDDFINEIIATIYKYIDTPDFSVKKLAELFNMSQSSFYRKVKTITNESIVILVRKVKMQRAVELLKTQRYHVKEVAEMVGYNDIPTFRKHFIGFYGVTPTDYIKNIDGYK